MTEHAAIQGVIDLYGPTDMRLCGSPFWWSEPMLDVMDRFMRTL